MKSNVWYNLNNSPYTTKLNGYTFYFSSQFNKNRFDKKLKSTEYETEALKLNSKYKCKINSQAMIAIRYYRMIEKRGFRILGGNSCPLPDELEIELVIV